MNGRENASAASDSKTRYVNSLTRTIRTCTLDTRSRQYC